MSGSTLSAAEKPVGGVAAVVVTYNRKALLLTCLRRLLAQQNAACDVFVIDNLSTDGTEEAVRALRCDRIRYHNAGKNLGGAGGFNLGIRLAAEEGYSRIWLMDDDTQPEPDALFMLLEAERFLPAGYGFLSSTALWTDGTECRMNRQKLRKDFYLDLPLLKSGIIRAEQATFVGLFLRADTVRKVGLPIREFFIWGDDIEYTRRIAVRHRMPCYVAGKSRVVHATADNTGSSIALDVPERIPRYRYAFRNENFLYRQEGIRGFAYYTAKCALNLWRVLAARKPYMLRRLGVIVGQYFAGLFFNPRVETLGGAAPYRSPGGEDNGTGNR